MVQKSNNRSGDRLPERIRKRSEQRRLEILRAASRVFRRRGFAETGMREIAAEADLSPGNLYHYFEGKHELLFFCQDRALEQMLEALRAARLSTRPVAEKMHDVIGAHVRCLIDEVEGSAAHLEVDALPEALRDPIVAKRDRYERGIRKLVSDGVKHREFAACDAKLVTKAMLGAINWTARWFRSDGPRPPAAVARAIADFLVRGLVCGADVGNTRTTIESGEQR